MVVVVTLITATAPTPQFSDNVTTTAAPTSHLSISLSFDENTIMTTKKHELFLQFGSPPDLASFDTTCTNMCKRRAVGGTFSMCERA